MPQVEDLLHCLRSFTFEYLQDVCTGTEFYYSFPNLRKRNRIEAEGETV